MVLLGSINIYEIPLYRCLQSWSPQKFNLMNIFKGILSEQKRIIFSTLSILKITNNQVLTTILKTVNKLFKHISSTISSGVKRFVHFNCKNVSN
jgi:hypothetical protein